MDTEPLPQRLKGKVALVTGAGRGLGRGIALRLARLGADVVVNDLHLDSAREFNEALTAESVVDECRGFGVRSIGIEADVTDREQVAAMVDRTVKEMGGLHILAAIAGGQLLQVEGNRFHAEEMNDADTDFIMNVNFRGTVNSCQEALRPMKEQGYGKIITMASGAAYGRSGLSAYGCAKAAIVSFTRSFASDVGKYGITVNGLAPAIIGTSRALAQFPERKDFGNRAVLGRIGTPEDVAKVVEFFASDLSDYVTGQFISVCGGMMFNAT